MSYAKPITQHRLKLGYGRRLLNAKPPKGWKRVPDQFALVKYRRDPGPLEVEIEAVPLEGPGYQRTPVGFSMNTYGPNGEYNFDNDTGDFTRLKDVVGATRKWMKQHPWSPS